MIDLRLLRSEPERVKDALKRRGSSLDLSRIIALDESHRRVLGEVETNRARQNTANKKIAGSSGDERASAIAEMKGLSDSIKKDEAKLFEIKADLDELLATLPNFLHPDTPDGLSDEANVVLKEVGEPRRFDFEPLDHLALGEHLDVIDVVRAAKVSGSRFGILKREAAILEFALLRWVMDKLSAEGFVPAIPPILVRREVLYGMGFFPSEESQAYAIPGDDLFLAGTSEAPLSGMHMDETLQAAMLPVRYAGYSSCFRREAGTYGKDTRGIIRVHQFDKVEMFVICAPEESDSQHRAILEIEEMIFSSLGIAYRVVDVCAGELGAPYSRKFDIEAWLPGSNRWLEVTSCSNALDYQARRLGIRFRGNEGPQFAHTLNGTGIAVQRAIVAIFETHQTPDQTVIVPEVLRPYAGFDQIRR